MKLYQQLILFMLAATVLPLAVVGFLLLSRAEAELAERISAEQRALAVATAESVEASLSKTVDAMARMVQSLSWHEITDKEDVEGALSLIYLQSPAVSAVMKLTAKGEPIEPMFFFEESKERPPGHPSFDPASLRTLTQAVPVKALSSVKEGEAAYGRVYAHSLTNKAAVAVAIRIAATQNADAAPFVLAEVVFQDLEGLLDHKARDTQGRIDLVDSTGLILASSDHSRRMTQLEAAVIPNLRPPGERVVHSFRTAQPALWASAARVSKELDFHVVVSVDEAAGMAPVRSMRYTVLLSIGATLLVLLTLGSLYTRRITQRISAVVVGVEAFSRGELHRRVEVSGDDEISALATTFNHMGAELEAANKKLQSWNQELANRVEIAKAELRAAEAQLLETRKLAAVGQLGAGVAHELNNPLAGILGYVQLMLMSRDDGDQDLDMLRKIEQSAKRCKEITQNLLRFSQQRAQADLRAVDLNSVVRDALALTENQMKGEGVSLVTELFPEPVRVKADPGHTSQVVLALVSNARTAMLKSPKKTLTVRTGERDGKAFLEVEDTGKGIAPEHRNRIFEPFFTTKDVWSNVGLGLSVAYRVVHEAGGNIDMRTEVGKGSCFIVTMIKA
jgi:signal transduction histidine kinase